MIFFQIILELIFFIISCFCLFYVPSKVLSQKLKLECNGVFEIFFHITFGLLLFTVAAYSFAWARITSLLVPIVIFINFYAFKHKVSLIPQLGKKNTLLLFFIAILSFFFSLPMTVTGIYGNTIAYKGDDIFHLSLINELIWNFPPEVPGAAGFPLRGYHFLYDFLLAQISLITKIAPFSLYFHLFPLLVSFLWANGVYSLLHRWSNKISVALWGVFLSLFGGSFGFILRLQGHPNINMDSVFGINQPASSLLNPHFSFSIVMIIFILYGLLRYFQSKQNNWLVPCALSCGLIPLFKIYGGIIVIVGISLFSAIELLKKKYVILVFLAVIALLIGSTYGIFARNAGYLILYPLWSPHKVLADSLPWYGYEEKLYTYSRLGVIKGLVGIELYGLFVFLVGNLGTRVLGLIILVVHLIIKLRRPSNFALILLTMTFTSIFVPMFFIQSGKVFEIIQMAWYYPFFISLFASFGIAKLVDKMSFQPVKFILISIIIFATLPSAYQNFVTFVEPYFRSNSSNMSGDYFESLQYLKSHYNYNETLLEMPTSSIGSSEAELNKWYRYSSLAIPVFANKRSYLNYGNMDFTGLDIKPRIIFLQKIILLNSMSSSSNKYADLSAEVQRGLKDAKISLIYSQYNLQSLERMAGIEKIIQKSNIIVYRLKDDKK